MFRLLLLSLLLLSSSVSDAAPKEEASPVRIAMQLVEQPDLEEAVNTLSYYGFKLLSNDGYVASFQSDNGTLVTYSIYSGQSDPEITVSTTAKPGEIEKILTSSGFSKVRTSNHQTKSDNPQPTTKNGQPITTYEKGSRLHPKSTVCTFLKGSPTILTFRKHSNL